MEVATPPYEVPRSDGPGVGPIATGIVFLALSGIAVILFTLLGAQEQVGKFVISAIVGAVLVVAGIVVRSSSRS